MTDKTPSWDGAPVIQFPGGSTWLRQPGGTYHHALSGTSRTPEELARFDPKPVELHPATTPEPPSVTWRKGEDRAEIREAWKPGRRARVVTETGSLTVTRDGAIGNYGHLESLTIEEWLDYGSTASITVWPPEAAEVPEWAQDYDIGDGRALVSNDGRVWRPAVANAARIEKWRWNGNRATDFATTEELVAMGARLLIDPDGKAVL